MPIYSKPKSSPTREAIIGLGERSVRKNYYPELQDKLETLERMKSRNQALMMAIPDVLLISDVKFHMTPFSTSSRLEASLVLAFLRDRKISQHLKEKVEGVFKSKSADVTTFEMITNNKLKYYEARFQWTDLNEVLIIIRDITLRQQMEQELRVMAERDYITGLFNRRFFESALTPYENDEAHQLTLIVFDIDGLKNINDTLGHIEGDHVIMQVAHMISEVFHDAKILARIGGNEFGVAYIDALSSEVEYRCASFQNQLSDANQLSPYEISVSYGIAHSEYLPIHLTQLYQTADHNLYKSKLLKEGSSKSALVRTLMKALEAKDFITEGHADRMSDLADKLGEALGLERHRMDQLRLLTKFHDIGKVGIPDRILKKPGPLNAEEWKIMSTHTLIGQRIAAASPELAAISDLILKHHEKWDGTGYPLKLSGVDIPLECRILGLVDTYDAMTNDRPYRNALSTDAAIAEILRCTGTQFDPELVPVFVEILKKTPTP